MKAKQKMRRTAAFGNDDFRLPEQLLGQLNLILKGVLNIFSLKKNKKRCS